MALRDFNDPQLGPFLSALIWFLALLVAFLVVTLPFSSNATAVGGAITAITVLLGLVIQQRGKIADRRRRK